MRANLALPACLALLLSAGLARCDQTKPPASPLRLLPAETEFFIRIQEPHKSLPLVEKHELIRKAQKLSFVKDKLDTTSFRRAFQMLAHVENKMGDKWPGLLEKVASGGIVLGARYGDKAPALLVIQGNDEKATKHFVALAVGMLEAELARQESKEKLEKRSEQDHDSYQAGPEFFAARMGATIVISNNKDARDKAIALYRGEEKKSLADDERVKDAAKLLPKAPLADAWFDMDPAHKSEGGKAIYKTPRDDFQLTLLFGAYLDVLGRSPYVAAALTHDRGEFELSLRAPRGREGMGADEALHLPPRNGPGCQIPLQPKGTVYSTSFCFDFAKIWQDREKLFSKTTADELTKSDKQSALFLLGTNRISTLLESQGKRHRFVQTIPTGKSGYKRQPKGQVQSFAFVSEQSDAKSRGTLNLALRAVALPLSFQFNLNRKEEQYKGVDVVGWRFDERKELEGDDNDSRFGYSPCFARVGRQLILCSTIELCRELIDELQAEQKRKPESLPYRSVDRFSAAGFAAALEGLEDQLITQAILDQGIEPAEAQKQVRELIDFVKGVGDVTSFVDVKDRETHYVFRFGK